MSFDTILRNIKYKPIVLLVLDGWGLSPNWGGNAISMNNPPTMNSLWRDYPHGVLQAFKQVAGPGGKVGSSEIGHASIGTGTVVKQDLAEISQAIKNGGFYKNSTLLDLCNYVNKNNSTLHLLGLLSDGGIHSHIDHLFALLDLAKKNQVKKVSIHLFTDGRDVDKTSTLLYLNQLKKKINELKVGEIKTVVGRYYAMDRDGNLDRTSLAYEAIVERKGNQAISAPQAITQAYKQGFTDEFIPPYVISREKKPKDILKDGDGVVFYNIRADRARQLTRFFVDKNFLKMFLFWRKYKIPKIRFVTLTDYRLDFLPLRIAYPPAKFSLPLARILSEQGFKQLHVAESEKYAHVTYFFNGGVEMPFADEDRIIIPSAKVKSHEELPQMQAKKITTALLKNIQSKKYDFIVANYANVDMLGHTGNILATSQAIGIVDQQIKKIAKAVLAVKGALIISADHGNAEQMVHLAKADTETMHTLNPVPFILVTPNNKKNLIASALTPTKGILNEILDSQFTLADIAPTILEMFDIAKPSQMTGKSLLKYLK